TRRWIFVVSMDTLVSAPLPSDWSPKPSGRPAATADGSSPRETVPSVPPPVNGDSAVTPVMSPPPRRICGWFWPHGLSGASPAARLETVPALVFRQPVYVGTEPVWSANAYTAAASAATRAPMRTASLSGTRFIASPLRSRLHRERA